MFHKPRTCPVPSFSAVLRLEGRKKERKECSFGLSWRHRLRLFSIFRPCWEYPSDSNLHTDVRAMIDMVIWYTVVHNSKNYTISYHRYKNKLWKCKISSLHCWLELVLLVMLCCFRFIIMAECEEAAEKRRRKSSVHVERYFPEPRKRRRHSMHRESAQPVANSGRDSGKKKNT